MGKKSSRKNGVGKAPGSITLREESGVKKKQTHVNAKSMLKLEHIKDIATWASGEGSIPSLGAFFGQRLAVSTESLGVPPDPSLFTCQRCESILQAGYNCTAQIEKNKRKARKKRKTSGIPPKNSVVYECHFCSHRNLKRGTPRGYMKSLYPSKPKTLTVDPAKSATRKAKVDPTESAMQRSEHLGTLVASIDKAKVDPTELAMHKAEHLDTSVASTDKARVDPTESAMQKSEHLDTSVASIDKTRVDTTKSATQKSEQFDALGGSTTDVIAASELVGDDPMAGSATPLSTVTVTSLLDSRKRKRNRTGSKKKAEPQDGSSMTDAEKTVSTSSKSEQFDALGGSTTDVIVASELVGDDPMAGPATPLSTVMVTSLLDSRKRKRNRTGSKKKAEPQDGSSMTDAEKTVSTSSKRKKKSWTSLKEIAESQSSNSRKFSNISVPFIL
ncbi:hypothetical protein KY285_022027 [Solanum tuberosum]|nr:hypothetical protein KY285_022027 [Solanum tuberosum]